MALITNEITYYRSTSYSFAITVTPPSGLSFTKAFFTVKTNKSDNDATDTSAILKRDATPVGDTATINIAPGDIGDSVDPGKYFYSIHVLLSDGKIYPFAFGRFTLIATTTNREA